MGLARGGSRVVEVLVGRADLSRVWVVGCRLGGWLIWVKLRPRVLGVSGLGGGGWVICGGRGVSSGGGGG